MIERLITSRILESIAEFPAIGILGARQVGKTTLAKSLIKTTEKEFVYLDLEKPSDAVKLNNAEYYFASNRDKCLILDEVQRKPELFPILRAEIDEHRIPGRFLLLGSASPELIRTSSESLAGRIEYHQLNPFIEEEIAKEYDKTSHWQFGGFPEVHFIAKAVTKNRWLDSFIQSYIERDLPLLGLNTTSVDLYRLLSMIAHSQGEPENDSNLANALGVKSPTIKRTIDFLEQSYLVHRLPAWFSNAKKRIVKSPRLYFSDTGILHRLLDINSHEQLLGHPILGKSFEAYCINQIIHHPDARGIQFYYYRTQDGTECDLVAVKNGHVLAGFEFKMKEQPTVTKSMQNSIEDLKPKEFYIVTPVNDLYQIRDNIWIMGIEQLCNTVLFNQHVVPKSKPPLKSSKN
ncbi:MAG: ATP-binding protein [Salibacteraceae bacterium]